MIFTTCCRECLGPVPCPSHPLVVTEPTVDQRAELGEALLNVSAMIEAAETTPVEVATMCLHCKRLPASKVEGPDGFTLCSTCYFATGIDDSNFMELPPRSAQDRMIAVLMAENERLRRALYACERILSGGES